MIFERIYQRTKFESSYIISGHENKILYWSLRHQLDHMTPKRIQLFQEYGTDSDNARLLF